jgi:hypothetical protein
VNHQHAQDLLPFYVAQTLPADDQRAIEAHIAHCERCQQDIREWRSIASATWSKADAAARQLPPLSQEVYNRLSYRDKRPQTRYSANPPRPVQTSPPQRQATTRNHQTNRRFALPLTLVAGLIVTLLVGGLLIAMNPGLPGQQADNIAMNSTQASTAIAIPSDTPQPTETDIPGIDAQGILPTPLPTETPPPPPTEIPQNPPPAQMPPTVTPLPDRLLPTDVISSAGTETPPENVRPTQSGTVSPLLRPTDSTASSSAESSAMSQAQGNGPYITQTPGITEGGAPLCYVINPTDTMIPLRPQANYDDPPSYYVQPGDRLRTLVRSADGWYQVFIQEPRQILWLAPQDAILEGNCIDLWLATPTVAAPPNAGTRPGDETVIQPLPGSRLVTIQRSFVDLRARPAFSSPTVAVVQQGEQYNAVSITEDELWVQLRLADGRELWAPADAVRITQAVGSTPTIINSTPGNG